MDRDNKEIHIEDDDARAARTNTGLRWVLAISLLLAVALLSAIWIFGALTQSEAEEEVSVSNELAQEEAGDETDSIVVEDAQEMADGI